jgi:hypothetical protein
MFLAIICIKQEMVQFSTLHSTTVRLGVKMRVPIYAEFKSSLRCCGAEGRVESDEVYHKAE